MGALRRCSGTGSARFLRCPLDRAVGGVDGVGFGREREIDDGLGEREIAFGQAEEVDSIARGRCRGSALRLGEADVFDGHADDAAREIHRVFAGFQHAAEPVERGVGIGVAHGFVQRGDEVVVLLAGFVVEQDAVLQSVGDDRVGDPPIRCRARGEGGRDIERVVGGARVAAGVGSDACQSSVSAARA